MSKNSTETAKEKLSLAILCGTKSIKNALIMAEIKEIELTYDYVSNILKDFMPGYNEERFSIKWETYLICEMIDTYLNLENTYSQEGKDLSKEIDRRTEELNIRKSKLNTISST